jgi:hypothetical protein
MGMGVTGVGVGGGGWTGWGGSGGDKKGVEEAEGLGWI